MSKDVINKIKDAINNKEIAPAVKPEESSQTESSDLKETTASDHKPTKEKAKAKQKVDSDKTVSEQPKPKKGVTGFEQLQEILKKEKEGFSFNRRLVYIDDNIGEALDVLRKEAKINSNVLASYLLKKFLLENKGLIKVLREKRKDNIFLD